MFSYRGTNSRTNTQVNIDPGAKTPMEEIEDQREALSSVSVCHYYLLSSEVVPRPRGVFKNPSRHLIKYHGFIFDFIQSPLPSSAAKELRDGV